MINGVLVADQGMNIAAAVMNIKYLAQHGYYSIVLKVRGGHT